MNPYNGEGMLVFDLLDAPDISIEKEEFIIDRLLPAGGRILMFGDTGAGKTQLALTMIESLIKGEKFLDEYETNGKRAMYIAVGDMPINELKPKLIKMLTENIGEEYRGQVKVLFVPQGIDIIGEKTVEIRQIIKEIKDFEPDLLIIDLVSTTHKFSMNDQGIAREVYDVWGKWAGWAGIVYLHHEKKLPYDGKINPKDMFTGDKYWINLTSTAVRIYEKGAKRYFQIVKPRNFAMPKNHMGIEMDKDSLLIRNLNRDPRYTYAESAKAANTPRNEIINILMESDNWGDDGISKSSAERFIKYWQPRKK